MNDAECRYSEPLPCRTCKHTLEPIGEFRRDESIVCDVYNSMDNSKPYGVLFCNEKCSKYEEA